MPRVGDVCYGYVRSQGNGYEVVSVSRCSTLLWQKVDLYASNGSKLRLSMYTSVSVLVTKIDTKGSRYQGRVLSIDQKSGILLKIYTPIMRLGVSAKERLYGAASSLSSPEIASFAVSILYGESHIQKEAKEMMRDLGVVHIMAVSGINIVYLMLFLDVLSKRAGKKIKEVISFLALIFLFILVGESVSLIRAVLMFVFDFILKKVGLRVARERFYVILIVMALVSPSLLGNYSYILVSTACFAVYQIVGGLREKISFFRKSIFAEALSSLVIWAIIVPVQWLLFGEISWMGAIVTIAVAPFVEVATVTGYVVSVLYFLHIDLLKVYLIVISLFLSVLQLFHGI